MKIKTRIMLALAIVNGLSLLAIVGLASHYLYTTNHLQFHERMEATVSLTAATLADAVTAKDLARIDAVISRIIDANGGAVRICVFDKLGQRLSTCRCQAVNEQPHPGEEIIEAPIIIGGVDHGSVGIAFLRDSLRDTLSQVRLDLWLLAVACLVIGQALAWWVGDTLATQINAILSGLRYLDEGQTPPTLNTAGTTSELDRVALLFNQLAAKRKTHD